MVRFTKEWCTQIKKLLITKSFEHAENHAFDYIWQVGANYF